ncbi:MAG TPA: hypothetical protein VNZ53_40480 [Steroidobacteraceae bacterium]|nr:hypothetical protein [Steroidobacteraceae bacterium]
MRIMTGISASFLLGLLPLCALPQSFIPKDLEGWQPWVLQDIPFLRCPFFANTNGTQKENRVCALPGRLSLEVTQSGGRFAQGWTTSSEGWIPLPGNNDNWPAAVALNGAPAAVVSRDGIPQIFVGTGTHNVTGQFLWAHRPESLAVPVQAGLISLTVDGQKIDQLDRADDAIWLGKHRDTEVAKQMDVQVYRLLTDGIPLRLDTRIVLRITGDPREEGLPAVLPGSFEATALRSPLPAHLGPDGGLRLQVRAGNWTVEMAARAPETITKISLAAAQGSWPKQEVWSYRSNDRLRVAVIEGAEGVDPSQANVPKDWRALPSYRVLAGSNLGIAEHNRGSLSQETNHLNLRRDLYLDFSHHGFTVVDAIDGQMRTDWRLDMRPPFTLAHARLRTGDLLITKGTGELTGVELRSPEIKLSTLARVDKSGGTLPATGWNERFDQVSATLTLPPGHRLLAALGADRAPGAWLEQWSLMDIFLVLLVSAVAFRLFGVAYAAVAFVGIALVHQESAFMVWALLFALMTLILFRQVPEGRFRTLSRWLHYAALAVLLVQLVPFAAEQIRFALYPQLADPGGTEGPRARELAQLVVARQEMPPPPRAAEVSPSAPPMQDEVVENPYGLGALISSGPLDMFGRKERYAPGAMVQAGPGIPQWQYVRYEYGWTGPVDAAQTVTFVVISPALVAIWRIAGVALLIALFWGMTRGDTKLRTISRRWFRASAVFLPLAFTALISGALSATSRAAETPDESLLKELKARLTQPSSCVPNCAETMSAHVAIEAARFEINLSVAALANVAIPLPTMGQRTDPGAISIDGNTVDGAYRDVNQQLWLALKPGVHSVKIIGHLSSADAIALLFPQVPRGITVTAPGWDVSGIAAGKLLGNTLQLTRRQSSAREGTTSQASDRFSPYVRVTREFGLALDWSVITHVERIAPERGGFTLEIPLFPGESVLTAGLETNGGTRVPASFDTAANEFKWESALSQVDNFELQAPKDKPWSEVWTFRVSPMWRVAFDGTPAVLPETVQRDNWTYEYYPRAGERLKVNVSRPAAVAGNTLAIDNVSQHFLVGRRTSDSILTFTYRSTQGNQHSVGLPAGARLTAVSVDGKGVPLQAESGQVQLALIPGMHHVQVRWQSDDADSVIVRSPPVDLQVASSNVTTTLQVGERWVLLAGGRGVGPAILYWGELAVFAVLALALGRSRRTPLRTHEWLLLGLGLSTFSWLVLLLVVVWMLAIRWREGLNVQVFGHAKFKVLQLALVGLSLVAVFGLVLAIPYGLLASPDMRIAGTGQSFGSLSWFTDQSANQLPGAWVLSVSLWWYKTAMLAWALWLAFALTRWLPFAWRALNAGSFWEQNTAPQIAGR